MTVEVRGKSGEVGGRPRKKMGSEVKSEEVSGSGREVCGRGGELNRSRRMTAEVGALGCS